MVWSGAQVTVLHVLSIFVWVSSGFSGVSKQQAGSWFDYTKLLLSTDECVKVYSVYGTLWWILMQGLFRPLSQCFSGSTMTMIMPKIKQINKQIFSLEMYTNNWGHFIYDKWGHFILFIVTLDNGMHGYHYVVFAYLSSTNIHLFVYINTFFCGLFHWK